MTALGDEVWYRYDSNWMREFKVIKHTLQGVWIEADCYDFWPTKPYKEEGYKKFILKDARKMWASPTKQQALDCWRKRKQKQIQILKQKIEGIEQNLIYGPKTVEDLEKAWNFGWPIDPIKIEL